MDGADRTLDGLVRPPHWQTPHPQGTYDLAEGGSRVDVRSLSRVGVGDVGTNAKRIRAYLDVLTSEARPPQ